MRASVEMLLAVAVAFAAGCGGGAAPDGSDAQPSAVSDSAAPAGGDAAVAHDDHADAAAAGGGAEGHAHAAEGEGRALLPIMQELGARMTAVTHGLMIDSAQLVASNAAAMAEHAPISAEELERIHTELGAEMSEFERLDEEVHETLVRLSDAAAAGRTDDVLTLLNQAQRGCVACHDAFRDRLRTNVVR